MKKKFFAIILVVVLLLCTGCNITPTMNIVVDSTPSWIAGGGYEKCTYEVIKRDKDGKVIGTGSMILTIDNEDSITSSVSKYSTTTCLLTFTQNGVTDTFESTATFNQTSMYCVKTEKKAIFGGANANKSYYFSCDYTSNEKKAYFAKGADCLTQTPTTLSTIDLEAQVLDNETLYYLIRSFNVEVQSSGSFLLTNLYDCYLNGRIEEYQVFFAKQSEENLNKQHWEHTSIYNNNTFDTFLSQKLNISETGGNIPTYRTTISRQGDLSGTPVEMWFIKNKPTQEGNTKLLARIKHTTYAVPSGYLDNTIDFLLTDYTTIRP